MKAGDFHAIIAGERASAFETKRPDEDESVADLQIEPKHFRLSVVCLEGIIVTNGFKRAKIFGGVC